MGNDGGSIPTRRELVKQSARHRTTTEVKESQRERQEYHWTTCPLSHRPLTRPIVSDHLGTLYNKDAVLQFLLPAEDGSTSKAEQAEEILGGRIRSLKDAVELRFEIDPDEVDGLDGAKQDERRGSVKGMERWVCPVTKKQLGPNVRSIYLVPCGHVFSESVQEMSEEICLQCNQSFTSENVIPILPTTPEVTERLRARAKSLAGQGLTHSLKKMPGAGKKRAKNGPVNPVKVIEAGETIQKNEEKDDRRRMGERSGGGGGVGATTTPTLNIQNAATASLTARVMDDQMKQNKRRKLDANDNIKALFSSSKEKKHGHGAVDKQPDFMTRGYSIPAHARR